MRRAVIVGVVFVFASLAGCTAETPGAATVGPLGTRTVSAAPSTSASPTPPTATRAVLSKPQAAKRYLAIVRPYNEAMERLEKASNSGRPLGTLTSLARATLRASKQEMRQLRSTPWPKVARKPVMRLAGAIQQSHQHWRAATQARSRQKLIDAVVRATTFGADAAKTIRSRLNLAKYDEGDY